MNFALTPCDSEVLIWEDQVYLWVPQHHSIQYDLLLYSENTVERDHEGCFVPISAWVTRPFIQKHSVFEMKPWFVAVH